MQPRSLSGAMFAIKRQLSRTFSKDHGGSQQQLQQQQDQRMLSAPRHDPEVLELLGDSECAMRERRRERQRSSQKKVNVDTDAYLRKEWDNV